MAASVEVELARERAVLYADRALYWPRMRRLLIADLHLGKGDVFRRAGIGVPRGGTRHDLQRLGRLFDVSGAEALWILGDVLHGPVFEADWHEQWLSWRHEHAQVRISALVGNHDRVLANAGLGIDLLGDAVDEPPFAFRHEPERHGSLHVLCGHLHPCVALPGLGHRRWPGFWMRADMTVLPAFSAFTGGFAVEPGAGEAIAVCVDDSVALIRAKPRPERREP